MKKVIEGKTYKLVDKSDKSDSTGSCKGCCAVKDFNLCVKFPMCFDLHKIWKEVKDGSEE